MQIKFSVLPPAYLENVRFTGTVIDITYTRFKAPSTHHLFQGQGENHESCYLRSSLYG